MGKGPREVRADREGIELMLEEGVHPDKIAVYIINAFGEALSAFMDTVDRDDMDPDHANTVAGLGAMIVNSLTALEGTGNSGSFTVRKLEGDDLMALLDGFEQIVKREMDKND